MRCQFCGVAAVDKLHMTVDEMHILDVKEEFYGIKSLLRGQYVAVKRGNDSEN
ncbi:hypothetical protein KOY48_01050 [Candidatus Minimicrobia naudis]|uniref:Uncharacterized protein n=1 Tax=Candidatus Minimicrobia naudis TaxID=2841263 RepID=A0A8F1SBN2_9BACT|nr:hypothetical protein KOY48_01050 [Candidatus Minimicrobia naudis]